MTTRRLRTPSTTGRYPGQLREPAQVPDGRRPTNDRNRSPSHATDDHYRRSSSPHRSTAEDVRRRQDNAPRTTSRARCPAVHPRTAAGVSPSHHRDVVVVGAALPRGSRCPAGGRSITSSCDPARTPARVALSQKVGGSGAAGSLANGTPCHQVGGWVDDGSTSMPMTRIRQFSFGRPQMPIAVPEESLSRS
jgi:hypothetical protein